MKAAPEEFETLRKILALKRYEQPPPGYFDQLAGAITRRLEAQNTRTSFWERLFSGMVLRPATAYAFGLAVGGVLVAGVGFAVKTSDEPNVAFPAAAEPLWEMPSHAELPAGFTAGNVATNPSPSTQPLILDMNLRHEPAAFNW